MAAREHEAVPVGPQRLPGVVTEEPRPEDVGGRGQGHRRSRVARVRLLDRIHGQRPDRVDAQPVEILGRAGRRLLRNRAQPVLRMIVLMRSHAKSIPKSRENGISFSSPSR